jgi:Zn-dependent protease
VFFAPPTITFGHVVGTDAGGLWRGAGAMLGAFFSVNLLLAAFNLLPLPPLDGSGAVPLFLSESGSRSYQQFIWSNRALGLLGILVAWKVFAAMFGPIFFGAVNLLYPGISYR